VIEGYHAPVLEDGPYPVNESLIALPPPGENHPLHPPAIIVPRFV
jgi:hypothetical protein